MLWAYYLFHRRKPFIHTFNEEIYIAFIRQDILASGADFQGDFPTKMGIRMDFLDNYPRYEFYLVRFILSVLLMYIIIICVRYLLGKLSKVSG